MGALVVEGMDRLALLDQNEVWMPTFVLTGVPSGI
jgi:hypothetical protein